MAFDKSFFDSIRLDPVRGKFYRVGEVEALLKEIAARAELQEAESQILQLKTEKMEGRIRELEAETDGAKEIARTLVSEAREEAEKILSEAREKAREILADADDEAREMVRGADEERDAVVRETLQQQEAAVSRMEEVYSAMKENHEESIEKINRIWQDFLSHLLVEEETPEEVPADLTDKVGAIKDALSDFEKTE